MTLRKRSRGVRRKYHHCECKVQRAMSEGSPATGGDLSISAWFWNPDIWLPPNVTWESFQESPAERNINREASWKTHFHIV